MIYCVEDDGSIRELMIYTLGTANYEAEGFENAALFWEAMGKETPDIIMLDIMLPDEDGISILKKIRENPNTKDIPVILATAKGTEYDKVMGLDCGADDYLVKPFGMMEMVSRVKAVLRRTDNSSKDLLSMGGITLDKKKHSVSVNDKPTEITLKEYDLLRLFMEHPGQVFTREALLSAIWDSDYMGESRTVDVHIGTLRTKLGKSGLLIKTVRGVGYRMEEDE